MAAVSAIAGATLTAIATLTAVAALVLLIDWAVTSMTTVNNLDAIASLPFSALSSPEAGEQIRDTLIAEIRDLRAERDALAAALADIAGMRLMHTEMDGTELWVADAECADMHGICHQRFPARPHDWCQTCVAEVAWSAWKMGVL